MAGILIFFQFQDTTYALPSHIHLPVCLWIMDCHTRAATKNTSHGNKVLPQDTTHLIQRPCYQRGSPCQQPAGSRTTRRPPDQCKKDANCSGMDMSPVHQVWPKLSCKVQWKGEEDQADRGRGGKTTSGNGQAWSSPSPRTVKNREKWRKLVLKSSVVPQRPSPLRDRWWWWWWWSGPDFNQ